MHDYFDILGLTREARAREIRQAHARRARRWHPDFHEGDPDGGPLCSSPPMASDAPRPDAAVDFMAMASLVERMQAAFFASR